MKLEVKQLSERPGCLTTVGNWIHEPWWHRRHDTDEVAFHWLRTHTRIHEREVGDKDSILMLRELKSGIEGKMPRAAHG